MASTDTPRSSGSTDPALLVVTPGCPAGIGPEIVAAALDGLPSAVDPAAPARHLIFAADRALLLRGALHAGVSPLCDGDDLRFRNGLRVSFPPELKGLGVSPESVAGQPGDEDLACQRDAVVWAIEAVKRGQARGLVTAPIRKASLQDVDGTAYLGHTELLQSRLGDNAGPALMCFHGAGFVLGLATVHLPFRDVPESLTIDLVKEKIERLIDVTRCLHGKDEVRIAVLGLNPHAGEGGLLGREEIDVIKPAIDAVAKKYDGVEITGPWPADGFFAEWVRVKREAQPTNERPHAVLAMSHDTGLAPYKVLSAGAAVNLTWGLTGVRTSPDHGTADSIAHQGKASAQSMWNALTLALDLVQGHIVD